MKKQRLLVLLTLICLLVLLVPMTASAASGWVQESDGWHYYDYWGDSYTGTHYIDGHYYRFNDNGVMLTGWYEDEWGEWYYYMSNGAAAEEFYMVNGKWYYFGYNGRMYEDTTVWYDEHYYRLDEDGVMVTGWYERYGSWYYYHESGAAAEDFCKLGGVWYFFDYYGRMQKDCYVWSEMDQKYYVLSEDGTTYEKLGAGWTQAFGNWYYAEKNESYTGGLHVYSYEILKYNGLYYAFKDNGQMADNEAVYTNIGRCRAKAGGALYANEWYDDGNDIWYYYTETGAAARDFKKVGGVWYFFDYDGEMRKDCYVWSDDYQAYYVLSQDGTAHKALNLGWTEAFGNWYYAEADTSYTGGVRVYYSKEAYISGNYYYFDYDGKMVTDRMLHYWNGDTYVYAVADSNGVLRNNGWFKQDGKWGYLLNGQICEGEALEIDGYYYAFDYNGYLCTVPGEESLNDGEYYVADTSGKLRTDWWRYREIVYEHEIGYVYYGSDGRMLEDEAMYSNGTWYVFDHNGNWVKDQVYAAENGLFDVNASGHGTPVKANSWIESENGTWYYADAEGLPADGVLKINGVVYGFYDGRMATYEYVYGEYNGVWGAYMADGNGIIYTKAGWVKMDGEWYYVQADGTLKNGWEKIGSSWYKFGYESDYYWNEYALVHDALFYDSGDQKTYYAAGDGVCTAVTGNGLKYVGSTPYYLTYGKVLTSTWKNVGGSWYYFSSNGFAYQNTTVQIDGKYYAFDINGKMQTGWACLYGDWYYADASGVLKTGMHTIGGQKYLFNDWGRMEKGGTYYYEGNSYLLAGDGHVAVTLKQDGWTSYNGKWYYCKDGSCYNYGIYKIDNAYYGFDSNGVMLTGDMQYTGYGEYGNFGANGIALTGWRKVNGHWTYARTNGTPYLYVGGIYTITGNRYVFDNNGYLMIGTFTYDMTIYTTNANGAVISQRAVDQTGWYYEDGTWYYTVKGDAFTGWKDDFFIKNGVMQYYTTLEYDGQMYMLKADGSYLKNGWYEYNGSWVLARDDGRLYCSTWVQQGGNWYYFDGYRALEDGIFFIDEAYHEFDENCKWLGEVEIEDDYDYEGIDAPYGLKDGAWYQNSTTGDWYYYHGDYPVTGSHYINGKYYFFDYETAIMVENGFAKREFKYVYSDGTVEYYVEYYSRYYYGADGAKNLTGWNQIGGQWYFFGDDNRFRTGLLRDSSGWCYAEIGENGYHLVKNECRVVNGSLYHFNGSGSASGPIYADGWYSCCGEWYYFESGALVIDGYRQIGGVGYYFWSGRMQTDTIEYYRGGYRYFGEDGAMVTKEGWYQSNGDWIYVGVGGNVYYNGIYMINGVQYSFRYGRWIS